ncbi:MAG: hypothetical protein ACTSUE_01220 [Promethearchaeota archaeon]
MDLYATRSACFDGSGFLPAIQYIFPIERGYTLVHQQSPSLTGFPYPG